MRPGSAGRKAWIRDHTMNTSRNARGDMFTHPLCATNGPPNSATRETPRAVISTSYAPGQGHGSARIRAQGAWSIASGRNRVAEVQEVCGHTLEKTRFGRAVDAYGHRACRRACVCAGIRVGAFDVVATSRTPAGLDGVGGL